MCFAQKGCGIAKNSNYSSFSSSRAIAAWSCLDLITTFSRLNGRVSTCQSLSMCRRSSEAGEVTNVTRHCYGSRGCLMNLAGPSQSSTDSDGPTWKTQSDWLDGGDKVWVVGANENQGSGVFKGLNWQIN